MKKVKLISICRPKQWKTIPTSELQESGYPVYGANGIIGFYDSYNHEQETVAITCRGATCGTVNLTQPKSYITGNAMCLDDVDDNTVEIKFLFYAMQSYDFTKVISGSAQPQITREGLGKVEVALYPLDLQKQIVNRLCKVDELIERRRQQLKELDGLVKSRFIELFREYPSVQTLADVATITGGLTKNAKRDKLGLRKPYLRVANVSFASIDTTEMLDIGLTREEYAKTLLKNGDLLFVEGNGSPDQIGRVAIWNGEIEDCVHQNHLIKARFDLKRMSPVFAMYYFISERGRSQIKKKAVSTSGLYTLSVSKIADFEIPNPPLELQQQFAAFVAQVDKSKHLHQIAACICRQAIRIYEQERMSCQILSS